MKPRLFHFSIDRLKQILDYDPLTGIFIWKELPAIQKRRIGTIAGGKNPNNGYISIKIDNISYMAHRLAWAIIAGAEPVTKIDHKNGITDDNRAENLREATTSQNGANRRLGKNNKSGFKGIVFIKTKRKWRSNLKFHGKRYYGDFHEKAEDAAKDYDDSAIEFFGEFAKLNFPKAV